MSALSIDIGDTLPLDWYHNVSGVSRSTVASVKVATAALNGTISLDVTQRRGSSALAEDEVLLGLKPHRPTY